MKKYIKYFLLTFIILASFYITEKGALFSKSKDPIMQSIINYSKEHNIEAVNAIINDNYIIPGMYGKRVNQIKSLMKMKSDGVFNSLFLITDIVKPNISLENNKDKIITKANANKKAISFILENDETSVITFLISNKIKASILVDEKSINNQEFFEQINNDFNNYMKVEKILNKNKNNKNICIISRNNKDFCLRHHKYLVKPTFVFNSSSPRYL